MYINLLALAKDSLARNRTLTNIWLTSVSFVAQNRISLIPAVLSGEKKKKKHAYRNQQ